MAKFSQFQRIDDDAKDCRVWINPDRVRELRPDGAAGTNIYFFQDEAILRVHGEPEVVIAQLTGANEFAVPAGNRPAWVN